MVDVSAVQTVGPSHISCPCSVCGCFSVSLGHTLAATVSGDVRSLFPLFAGGSPLLLEVY